MQVVQAAVILPTPPHARYVRFDLAAGAAVEEIRRALSALAERTDGKSLVVGLGVQVVTALGKKLELLREFPTELRMDNPEAPVALWCWQRGVERGDLWNQTMELVDLLQPAFTLRQVVDAFTHQSGHDLTGYEDGTENPKGQAAMQAAFLHASEVDGLNGSSFVAVQQWSHEWAAFNRMSKSAQDDAIGRERVSNEELEDAPESSHVKRTAQEDFSPEAFVMRRSMPWTDELKGGLMFVAFGCSLYAFEAQWRRMLGLDDGIKDALFQFSQPMTHDYYWCPPINQQGRLNLQYLDI